MTEEKRLERVEQWAKVLRDVQAENGRLPDDVVVISPSFQEDEADILMNLLQASVVVDPTAVVFKLGNVSYHTARDFEDNNPEVVE